MEDVEEIVTLYNSTVCRLCAVESENNTLLYTQEDDQDISTHINRYLPLKIYDDGKYPRSICPGCTIQLDCTSQFFDLILQGQAALRELLQTEFESLKQNNQSNEDDVVDYFGKSEIDGVLYTPEHELALKIAGCEKPKRKRGRPPKPPPDVLEAQKRAREALTKLNKEENEKIEKATPVLEILEDGDNLEGEGRRKRRRKAPTRFSEAVQGKELDRIFVEEGVILKEEIEDEYMDDNRQEYIEVHPDTVIGHIETREGIDIGELILKNKTKSHRGRKKKCRHSCDVCGLVFMQSARFLLHKESHGDVKFECCECLVKFETKVDLNQHQCEKARNGEGIIDSSNNSVENSNENNSNKTEIKSEELIVSNITTNDVCEEKQKHDDSSEDNSKNTVADMPPLEESVPAQISDNVKDELDVDVQKFKCDDCDKTFQTKQNVEVHHKAVHQGERPYNCTICEKSFAYHASLKGHLISHQDNKDKGYPCNICGKVLNRPSSLVYHKDTEHNGCRFVCKKCGKSFKHPQLLQRHQIVHSTDRPHGCKTCSAAFKTKANLLNHEATHTGVKKYQCSICNQQFAHKTSLTLHHRWHSGSKPFKCPVCEKCFSQNGNLQEHLRIHTGVKPYICELCQRSFTTSSQFKLHSKRHTGERPWACDRCDKTFLHKDTWKCHMRRHIGDKPFKCTMCERKFAEQWALKKHWRSHTGEKPHSCEFCGKSFADISNLSKHTKLHIKMGTNRAPLNIKPKTTPISPNMWRMIQSQIKCPEEDSGNTNDMAMLPDEVGINLNDDLHSQNEDIRIFVLSEDQDGAAHSPDIQDDGDSLILSSIEQSRVNETDMNLAHKEEMLALNNQHLQLLDEQGNLIRFTVQDANGQQIAIATLVGETIQVELDNGQTVPIQLDPVDGAVGLSDDELQGHVQRALEQHIQLGIEQQGDTDNHSLLTEEQAIELVTADGQKVQIMGYEEDLDLTSEYITIV